jgi:hypothetical protein
MSKRFYLCENEYGADPCQYALEGRRILETEISPSIDDDNPRCPGKTKSDKECNQPLIEHREESSFPWKWLGVGVAALFIVVLLTHFLAGRMGPAGEPVIRVEPSLLVLPRTDTGPTVADILVRNEGDGDLIVEQLEVRPAVFSATVDSLRIAPAESDAISVRFQSDTREMAQGEVILHSNAIDSPTTVRLIANQDPWWVYERLATSSDLFKTEP